MKTFLILIIMAFLGSVVGFGCYSLYVKNNRSPKIIGGFEFFNTKTSVVLAGGCAVFMTQFEGEPKPMFFFSCEK
jgi:hypothetical protein